MKKEFASLAELLQAVQGEIDAAAKAGHPEPTAFHLATASEEAFPSTRVVLCKGIDESSLSFYTNLGSQKAHEIRQNPQVCMNFMWHETKRQIRIQGIAELVSDTEADEYFASRARLSQIGAWASRQSEPMQKALEFEKRIAKYTAKFALGAVPRPDFWSGFRIKPTLIEFWQMKDFRLHERYIYSPNQAEENQELWESKRYFP